MCRQVSRVRRIRPEVLIVDQARVVLWLRLFGYCSRVRWDSIRPRAGWLVTRSWTNSSLTWFVVHFCCLVVYWLLGAYTCSMIVVCWTVVFFLTTVSLFKSPMSPAWKLANLSYCCLLVVKMNLFWIFDVVVIIQLLYVFVGALFWLLTVANP